MAACGPADQPKVAAVPDPARDTLAPAPVALGVRLLDRPAVMPVARAQDLPLSRVEVTWAGRTDTVPEVLVRYPPALLGDSALTGLDWNGTTLVRGFRFVRGARDVASIALPQDLPRGAAVVRLSPDGRYIAYVAEARCGASHCAKVSIRRWPTLGQIGAYELNVRWGDRLDPRDRIDWLDPWRVAFELYDGQRGERTVALVRLAAGGVQVQRQPIPRTDDP
ncbi:MAG: hypothetical protein MUF53_07755 [Gemmatimonadaceae bacterium]|nr:hypothetical protein [Gemmatimonadaceae bacterium]